jgi:hypothetical protein
MKHIIEIRNGSGWNNYTGLANLKSMPAGTKGLMKANGVAELHIGPTSREKPFGISARYIDADGEQIFEQRFDQNSSAAWIRERITALLEKGIAVRKEEISAHHAVEALKEAIAAGFPTVEEHRKARDEAERAAREKLEMQKQARIEWLNGANGGAEAGAAALAKMASLKAANPEANAITRKGRLIKLPVIDGALAHASVGPEKLFTENLSHDELEGMKAWLIQNGHRATVDDRSFFFAAA